jgi:TolB-like protein/Tfp pilus assembly protein PilF/tRNA A-37 threonylcarbamoyl transferase component Bud32
VTQPLPPRLVSALGDRYRIERELGQGGMATVYLAEDLKHDRKVAIKVLRPELAAALGAERFLAEIRTTAKLQHPHILPLLDSGDAEGLLYYVMPLAQGESLHDRLAREQQLPIDETIRIVQQVASGLDFAHRHGVIHRDIKPDNILLHDGEALLADFGIALALRDEDRTRLTETGLSLGTPQYMSPEQALSERDLDARADVYSLGAVTYEMLTGEPPVSGSTTRAILAKLLTERPTSVRLLRDSVPPSVDRAVQRALEKTPTDRFATAREFADALSATDLTARPASPRVRRTWIGIAAVVLLIGAAGAYLSTRRGASAAGSADAIRSLAVLPFDNYSADSTQEYFAEGMTDELTTDLATISQLRVVSRGSAMQFTGTHRPPTPEIAKALHVDAVVEGSVTREGDRVRITAQLIDARADRHIWARSFERKSSDVLALQADLASAIASAINAQITPGERTRLAAAPSIDPAAHDAYLRGRYFFARPSDANLKRAITAFNQAVQLSADFAPAWSGLSDAYLWAAFNEGFISAAEAGPKARAAALRAVQLDSSAAEGHASLATYLAWFAHDWAGSEAEFRRAIAINPNYAFAHDQFGLVLTILGRFDEAIAEGKKAMTLDPLSPAILVDAMEPYIYQHDAPVVQDLRQRATALDPTFYMPWEEEAELDLQLGRYREAISLLEKARALDGPSFVAAELAYAYGKAGDEARARAALADLKRMSRSGEGAPWDVALFYLGQGDTPHALDYLEKAFGADAQQLVWLEQDAIYDPLRRDPRFIALMRQMHLAR